MLSKNKIVLHSNNVVFVFRIVILKVLKYFYLYPCLMMKFLLISHDFHCYIFIMLMVKAFQALSKTPWTQRTCDFISIGYMIFQNNIVVSFIIIISKIILKQSSFYLVRLKTKKVYLLIVHYFCLFIICDVRSKCFKNLRRRKW